MYAKQQEHLNDLHNSLKPINPSFLQIKRRDEPVDLALVDKWLECDNKRKGLQTQKEGCEVKTQTAAAWNEQRLRQYKDKADVYINRASRQLQPLKAQRAEMSRLADSNDRLAEHKGVVQHLVSDADFSSFGKVPAKVPGRKFIASCSESSKYGDSFGCDKAIDGAVNLNGWETNDEGIGSWIMLYFSGFERINAPRYANIANAANQDVQLHFSDGTSTTVTLENDGELHSFSFPEKVTSFVNITVSSVYLQARNGAQEIQFWYKACGDIAWQFEMDSNNNLMGIKKGPLTDSGKTEVHRMNAVSGYKDFDFRLGTGLDYTDSGQDWDFVLDSNDNLVGIKKGPTTDSGLTEVHRLTAASNYATLDLQQATGLGYTSGEELQSWAFVMDSHDNLMAIKNGPATASGKTEIYELSAASGYTAFSNGYVTALTDTSTGWDFVIDSNDNLIGIKKGPTTDSGMTEIHRLSAASNYTAFDYQAGTGLHYTSDEDWAFVMDSQDNLIGVKEGPWCDTGMTEVHRLSSEQSYQHFDLQTTTALELTCHADGLAESGLT